MVSTNIGVCIPVRTMTEVQDGKQNFFRNT